MVSHTHLFAQVLAHWTDFEGKHALRKVFSYFDKHKSGVITFSEFEKSLARMGTLSEDELFDLFEAIDLSGDTTIHYSEFLGAAMEALHSDYDTGILESHLKQAFRRMDREKKGFIDQQCLEMIFDTTSEKARHMLDQIGRVQVDLRAFLDLFPDRITGQRGQPNGKRLLRAQSAGYADKPSNSIISMSKANQKATKGSKSLHGLDAGTMRKNDFLAQGKSMRMTDFDFVAPGNSAKKKKKKKRSSSGSRRRRVSFTDETTSESDGNRSESTSSETESFTDSMAIEDFGMSKPANPMAAMHMQNSSMLADLIGKALMCSASDDINPMLED